MTRIEALDAIEARLLELAHTTDAKITAPALAFFAPCSLENAQRVLDDLAGRNLLTMDVSDDGTLVYDMPGRQQLPADFGRDRRTLRDRINSRLHRDEPGLRREVETDREAREHALVLRREQAQELVPYRRRSASVLIAVLLAIWFPGAGHLYTGRWLAAFLWFLVIGAGYTLILPGLVFHLFSIASAAGSARRLAEPSPRYLLPARSYA